MKRVTTSSNSNQRKPTSPLEYLRGTNFYPISSLLQLQLHQSYRDKLELELELHLNFAETNFSTCSSPTATLTSHLWQGCQTSILQKKSINFVFTGMIFLSDFQKVDNLQNKRSTSIPRLNSSPIGQTFYIFSSSMEGLIFNTVNTHCPA